MKVARRKCPHRPHQETKDNGGKPSPFLLQFVHSPRSSNFNGRDYHSPVDGHLDLPPASAFGTRRLSRTISEWGDPDASQVRGREKCRLTLTRALPGGEKQIRMKFFLVQARIFNELLSRDRETGNPLAGLSGAQRARRRSGYHLTIAGCWF